MASIGNNILQFLVGWSSHRGVDLLLEVLGLEFRSRFGGTLAYLSVNCFIIYIYIYVHIYIYIASVRIV